MDKPHSLNVAANAKYHIQNPGKMGGGNKNSDHDDGSPSHAISQRKQGSHSTWKTWKMRVHLENLEISWNFEKFNKYHGKMT